MRKKKEKQHQEMISMYWFKQKDQKNKKSNERATMKIAGVLDVGVTEYGTVWRPERKEHEEISHQSKGDEYACPVRMYGKEQGDNDYVPDEEELNADMSDVMQEDIDEIIVSSEPESARHEEEKEVPNDGKGNKQPNELEMNESSPVGDNNKKKEWRTMMSKARPESEIQWGDPEAAMMAIVYTIEETKERP